jgi:transcription initiation factor TFIIIB Brf1 subunit/transcription initiation factor TFIIB
VFFSPLIFLSGVVVKCPFCGFSPVIYDAKQQIIVCPHCGSVIDDRLLMYVCERRESGRNNATRDIVNFKPGNVWRRASIELAMKMYNRVFYSSCTLEAAIDLIRKIYASIDELPRYDVITRFAILVASRKCGEYVEFKKLFSRQSDLTKLLAKYDYLRQIYIPSNPRDSTLTVVHSILKCLVNKGVLSPDMVVRVDSVVRDIHEGSGVYGKPRTIAAGLVYVACVKCGLGVKYRDVAKCAGMSVGAVLGAVRRHFWGLIHGCRSS